MSTLAEISNDMGTLVERAGLSVVRMEARRRFPASGIVWSSDGMIVTANHVLRRDDNIGIGFADGGTAQAQVVGRDPSTDLALVKVDAADLPVLETVDDEEVVVGNIVLALGRPGRTVQATLGIVSALGSGWHTPRGGQVDRYLQTDVLMYPGFSGGPLVSASGALLGLNSSAIMQGVSIALPVITVKRVVDTLQQHGRVRRGYLGVSTQVVRLQDDVREELGQKSGLLVIAVEPGSPAEAAGLKIGDTIVKMDITVIRRHEDLMAELMQANLDEKTPMTIVRGGEVQTINVKIGERT
jgi:S1-C subfamily serine protease